MMKLKNKGEDMKKIVLLLLVLLLALPAFAANTTLTIFEVTNKNDLPAIVYNNGESLVRIAEDDEYLYFAKEKINFNPKDSEFSFTMYVFPRKPGMNNNVHFKNYVTLRKANAAIVYFSAAKVYNMDDTYNFSIDSRFLRHQFSNVAEKARDKLLQFTDCEEYMDYLFCKWIVQ